MGKIIAICTSKEKGTNKTEVPKANLILDFGIEGDAHGGNWHRQISFLAKEEIDKFNERGGEVVYGDFGENIVTEGIDYKSLKLGDKIKLGNAILEITQFGKECHDRCQIYYRVGDCIMPKCGVFAKIITPGEIKVNDITELV